MIENKFLYFKTYNSFIQLLNAGNINDNSIVFIEDRSIIWTHGKEFTSNVRNLINTEDIVDGAITEDKIATGAINMSKLSDTLKGYLEITKAGSSVTFSTTFDHTSIQEIDGIKYIFISTPIIGIKHGDTVFVSRYDGSYIPYPFRGEHVAYYDTDHNLIQTGSGSWTNNTHSTVAVLIAYELPELLTAFLNAVHGLKGTVTTPGSVIPVSEEVSDLREDFENLVPGVDTVPTEDSINLVTSGGIYDAIYSIEQRITAIEQLLAS